MKPKPTRSKYHREGCGRRWKGDGLLRFSFLWHLCRWHTLDGRCSCPCGESSAQPKTA